MRSRVRVRIRVRVKIFLGPYDSLFDSESVFRRPMGIRKIWSLSNRLSQKKIDVFHPIFYIVLFHLTL